MEKKKIIIDCDPGIDDSLAIMLALKSEEVEVVGITIVSGNVHTKVGAENALKVLKELGRLDIPVYIGSCDPLKRKLITAEDTHGEDGLGESFFPKVEEVSYREGAIEFILDTLRKEKITIIALGPLTNIARCLQKDEGATRNMKELVLMGGAFKSFGNCSQVAEFNFWVDPDAAEFVFNNLERKITMVVLDVTRKCVLTPNYIEMIKQLKEPLSEFITKITRFYVDFHWNQEGIIGCVINDPLAVAYFINRNLCKGFTSYVEVVHDGIAIGQSIVDVENFYKKEHNAVILTEVDHTEFMYMFLERLFPSKKDLIRSIEGVI